MFRSSILLPGSDFLIAGLTRLALVIGLIGLAIATMGRMASRIRHRAGVPRDASSSTAAGWTPVTPVEAAGTGPGVGVSADRSPRAAPTTTRAARRPWHRPRSRALVIFATVTIAGLVGTVLTWPPSVDVPEFPDLPKYLLPRTALFYRPITDLPVAADSARWIRALESMPVTAPFGGKGHLGNVGGVPFNVVSDSTERVDVALTQYPANSFPGPYPIAKPPWIEGFFGYGGDQHYLAIDPKARRAWELISARRWLWRWEAGAGTSWSMDSLDYPTGGTIVARLPFLPGIVRFDEVESGSVDHVILAGFRISARGKFVWPARASDGVSNNPDAPPMGTWLRLRQDADLGGLGPQATVIARAAQRYGVLISDTGPRFTLRGTPDSRWDRKDLATLGSLTTDDFEAVDASTIMVSPDSLEVTQPER